MPRPRIRIFGPVLAFAAIFLAGCAVPLGPGFRHLTRDIIVTEVPAANVPAASVSTPGASGAQLLAHVEISDSLQNVGNRNLAFLDVAIPAAACDPADVQRRSIGQPSWQPRQMHTAKFSYDLSFQRVGSCGASAITQEGVYLTDPTAFPTWLAPPGPLSTGNSRAVEERVRVTLPSDYSFLAPGRESHGKPLGAEVSHEFLVRSDDFPFYLIAGRYKEQRVSTESQTVIFWTLQPLAEQTARAAAERLAATTAAYEAFFGPLPRKAAKKAAKNPWPIHIVETSANLAPRWPSSGDATPAASASVTDLSPIGWAVSFPEGVLLDSRAVAQGLDNDAVLRVAEYQLAGTWFDWSVRPGAGAQLMQSGTMGRFGIIVAAAARGGDAARRAEIARLIEEFDRDAPPAGAKGAGDQLDALAALQRSAWQADRGALFCVALEDMAGRENMRHALQRVLQALPGQVVEDADLRSALEAETGRDFAAAFHTWLDHAAIPADFRVAYAAAR